MENSLTVQNQSSLVKKSISSFVAGINIAVLLLLIGNGGNILWFPPAIVFPLVALTLLTSLVFPFIWQVLERKQKINSIKIYGILNSIIRYAIAINIASFGWKKLFGLQFLVPNYIASQPMNQQSGEWLTWYYFGYSYSFGLIIAFIQLIGACLLLFRRTLLLGSFVLFALLMNIMLINIFYHMNLGALLQSVITTLGVLFLLLLDYDRIKALFFHSATAIPSFSVSNGVLKNILRLSAIVVSLLFTIYLKTIFRP